MSRATETGVVICPRDRHGNPRLSIKTTAGETWVIKCMKAKGRTGVTTRDFLGADLRHYIRSFKNKGIEIRDEWETDAFGRHKRWWLNDGYTIECVPKKTKAAGVQTKRLSNSSPDGENGGISNG